jgi:hypothetical protein
MIVVWEGEDGSVLRNDTVMTSNLFRWINDFFANFNFSGANGTVIVRRYLADTFSLWYRSDADGYHYALSKHPALAREEFDDESSSERGIQVVRQFAMAVGNQSLRRLSEFA